MREIFTAATTSVGYNSFTNEQQCTATVMTCRSKELCWVFARGACHIFLCVTQCVLHYVMS